MSVEVSVRVSVEVSAKVSVMKCSVDGSDKHPVGLKTYVVLSIGPDTSPIPPKGQTLATQKGKVWRV